MSASQPGYFNPQFFTSQGDLAESFRLYTYAAGTTTHKTAYTEPTASTAHTYTSDGIGGQYIATNARGELPSPLYLTGGAYDIALKTMAGVTVWTRRAAGVDDNANTLDSALRAELAASDDDAEGAGMVGFGIANAYPAGTAGSKLRDWYSVRADGGAAADGAANDQAAIEASGHSYNRNHFPAATYRIDSTVTYDGQRTWLDGDGPNVSVISFSPAAADVALHFETDEDSGQFQSTVSGFGFTSSNSTDKTAINAVNCANFTVRDIGIPMGSWLGDSIFLRTAGRQFLHLTGCEIACARPVVIAPNATYADLAADHFLIENCELVGTSATRPIIEFEDGVSLANTTLRNLALALGKDGVLWEDTTGTFASFNVLIENFRTEQGLDATGWSVRLASASQALQTLTIRNAYLDPGRNGIRLRNARAVSLENVSFPPNSGRVALDMTFVSGSKLTMRNCANYSGATFTLTNARCIRRIQDSSGVVVDAEYIYDAASDAGWQQSDAFISGVPKSIAQDATAVLSDDSFTGFAAISTGEDAPALYALCGPTHLVYECLDPGGLFSATKDTGSRYNVYWDAGSSRYLIQNKRTGTQTITALLMGGNLP